MLRCTRVGGMVSPVLSVLVDDVIRSGPLTPGAHRARFGVDGPESPREQVLLSSYAHFY
jgi:hypothetical protein